MALLFGPTTFRIVRGLTWAEQLILRDSADLPMNLTGATFIMRVRESLDATTTVLELSSTNGRLSSPTPIAGEIQILVSADDTLLFPENGHERATYVYDLVILRAGPPQVREPVVAGRVIVLPQVTRPWVP